MHLEEELKTRQSKLCSFWKGWQAVLNCTRLYWAVLVCTILNCTVLVRVISQDDMRSENIWFSWSNHQVLRKVERSLLWRTEDGRKVETSAVFCLTRNRNNSQCENGPRRFVYVIGDFILLRCTAVKALMWNNGTALCKIEFNRNLSFLTR